VLANVGERRAHHRHDIGGKSIGLGLYSVYTRGLRFGDAGVAQAKRGCGLRAISIDEGRCLFCRPLGPSRRDCP
jgi:hypothetical protein